MDTNRRNSVHIISYIAKIQKQVSNVWFKSIIAQLKGIRKGSFFIAKEVGESMEIFRMFGSVLIKDEDAIKSLDNIDNKAKKTGGGLAKLGKIAAASGAAIGAGAAAGGAALLALVNKTSKLADEIDKMSIRTGISRTQLQELKFAAGQTGVAFTSIQSAAARMTMTMGNATEEGNKQALAFERLGVTIRDDVTGELRSSNDVFNEAIRALASMENETERNALGMEIFGRGFTEMIPLVAAGAEGIDNYSKRAHELGAVLSDEAIEANVKFQDTLHEVRTAFMGVVAQIGNSVLPMFQGFLDFVMDHMPTIQAMMQTVFGAIHILVETVFSVFNDKLLPILNRLWEWIQPHLPMVMQVFEDIFEAIGIILEVFVETIENVINWLMDWVAENEEKLMEIWEQFEETFEALKELIIAFIELVTEFWEQYGEDILNIIIKYLDMVMAYVRTVIQYIQDVFKVFTALFRGDWDELWTAIQNLFSNTWDNITNLLGKYFEYIKSIFTAFGKMLGDVWSGIWTGIKNIFKTYIDYIKTIISTFAGVFGKIWSGIWDGAKNTFDNIFGGIVKGIKDMINNIIGSLNKFVGGTNKTISNLNKVPGVNIPRIPNIPMLAKGGDITQGGSAIVGEAGPELLDLPKGAKVTPLKGGTGQGVTVNINGAMIMDDYGVDRMMDRVIERLAMQGVS